MFRHRCSRFTLIEKLVSIATITILAAILFPVVCEARDIMTISNLQELGIATTHYQQDYDRAGVPFQQSVDPT